MLASCFQRRDSITDSFAGSVALSRGKAEEERRRKTHLVLHVPEETADESRQMDNVGRLVLLEERHGLLEVPADEGRKTKVSTAFEEGE